MPPKGYTGKWFDQWRNSYSYSWTGKSTYESPEDYIERNMELLDAHNYQSFIDNCPSRLFIEVMDILDEAEINWTIGLTKEHINRIDKARGYPF